MAGNVIQSEEQRTEMMRRAARWKVRERLSWEDIAYRLGYKSTSGCREALAGGEHRKRFMQMMLEEQSEHLFETLEPDALEAQRQVMERFKDSHDPQEAKVAQKASKTILKHVEQQRDFMAQLLEVEGKKRQAAQELDTFDELINQFSKMTDSGGEDEIEEAEEEVIDVTEISEEGQAEPEIPPPSAEESEE